MHIFPKKLSWLLVVEQKIETFDRSATFTVRNNTKKIRRRRRLGAWRVYGDEAKREIQTISALIQ